MERFVSEPIDPDPGSFDPRPAASGTPAFPWKFAWSGKTVEVDEVLDTWKDTGPCSHGSGEKYVRKHWYRIRTTDGDEMRIYFERRARSTREQKTRWWLYTVDSADREDT